MISLLAGTLPARVSQPATVAARKAASPPPAEPKDRFSAGQAAAILDTAIQPVDLKEVTLRHIEADDHHTIEEVLDTPDGRRFIIGDSFDTSRDRRKDPGGYLEAYGTDGDAAWRFTPEGGFSVKAVAVTADRVYVSCQGEDHWDKALLVALDSQGNKLWDKSAGEKSRGFGSLRVGPDGTVYVKAEGRVTALDPSGKKKWSKKLSIHSSEFFHLMYPDGSQLFVNDGFSMNFGYDFFRKLSPDGKETELDLPDIDTFPLEVGDRFVYGGKEGKVHGIDRATGETWEVQTDSLRGHKTPWQGQDGNIYLEGRYDDNTFYCISPDGRKLWQRKISDAGPPGMKDNPYKVDGRGYFYYEHEDGGIQQILPDGKPGRKIAVPAGIRSFAVSPGGKLYIHDYDDRIILHDPDVRASYPFPLELENANIWDIETADDQGNLELRTNYDVLEITLSRDAQIQRVLDQANRPEPPAPTIKREQGWVVIGGVRVPVRD